MNSKTIALATLLLSSSDNVILGYTLWNDF